MGVSSGRCLTAGSGARAGIWVRVLEFWIHPAFPVLF